MICPRCLKRDATVHISRNINGKKEEYIVCSQCAKEMGFFNNSDLLFGIGDFMHEHNRACQNFKAWLQQMLRIFRQLP